MANKLDYANHMEQELHNLSFQLDSVKTRLTDGLDSDVKTRLHAVLNEMEDRRDDVAEKLAALRTAPTPDWVELKAELDQEWDMLLQDFEERIGSLAYPSPP